MITPACTLTGAPAPISAIAGNFTLTASFTGAILDECNDSALNGDGYTLIAPANASIAVQLFDVTSTVVTDLVIVGARTGILAEGIQNSAVTGNSINASGYGIEVEYSSDVNVYDNVLTGDYGSLYQVDDGLNVSYNQMSDTGYAIYAEDVNGASFVDDQCNGSTSGVSVYDSSSVTVWGDNLSHTSDGLFAQDVNHLTIDWNNASFSQYPIQVYYGGTTFGTENAGSGATIGLTLYFTDGATFTNEQFPDASEYGAEIEDATNVSLTGSDLDAAGFEGIFVGDASQVTLTADTADGFVDGGVVVSQSTDVTVVATSAVHGTGSLAPAFSTYFDQGFTLEGSNGSYSAFGLEDQGSLNLTVEDCQFWSMVGGGAGISLQADSGVTVASTSIIGASGDALDAFDSTGLVVRGNTLTHAALEAVYVASSDGALLSGNDAAQPGFTGFDLEQLDGFTVRDNNASVGSGPNAEGIYLQSDASGSVSNNSLTGLQTALTLLDSTGVTVTGNALSISGVGFDLAGDVSCTIDGNEVAQDATAFNVGSSEQLAIFHNNFVADGGWVLPPSTLVANWSSGYPGGGNFWSNWTTPDTEHGPSQNLTGADGIVDEPFVLNATNVDRYPLAAPWTVRTIVFAESGLPSGTPWGVSIDGTVVAGTGPSLVFPQPNAVASVYAFTVDPVAGYRATEPSGTVAPGDGNATVLVAFVPFEFPVTFQAAGLASSANWTVALGTTTGTATGAETITFQLANGTYRFDIAPVVDYTTDPSNGSVSVDGTEQSITVSFTLVEYRVTFIAVGFSGGASWSVTFAGSAHSSTGSSVAFDAPNGSYGFAVIAPAGYAVAPASGNAYVNGTTNLFLAFSVSGTAVIPAPIGEALLGATVVLGVVAVVAIALWLRARRPPPASGAAAGTDGDRPSGPPEGASRWRQ